MLKTFID